MPRAAGAQSAFYGEVLRPSSDGKALKAHWNGPPFGFGLRRAPGRAAGGAKWSEPLQRFRPCQAALADRPQAGPGWLHEIKFDGYRVIARKDGEQVRLWARTTSDYSKAFSRIRDAVAALPVDSAVIDGEAVVFRPDNTSDFEALRSREGQAGTILVAYDLMEANGQDIRPEPLERAQEKATPKSSLLCEHESRLRSVHGKERVRDAGGSGTKIFAAKRRKRVLS